MESHLRFPRQAKIIGGTNAIPNEFPYQVHVDFDGRHDCGGSILSALVILTAAHCLKYYDNRLQAKLPSKFQVIAGDHDQLENEGTEQVRNVTHLFLHEDYDSETNQNDIALMILSSPLVFNRYVQPIDYPKSPTEFSGMGIVSGWGRQIDDDKAPAVRTLQRVSVPIVPKKDCKLMYKNMGRSLQVTELMMCAGSAGKDSCPGDSGGPLVCSVGKIPFRRVLCGIVSFGYKCGKKGFPGVYTDVSYYSSWIEKTIANFQHRGKCNTDSFYCLADKSCIPRRKLCDDQKDCSDNADERTCKKFEATKINQYRCSNGESIDARWVCDAEDDCGDRTDEDKCDIAGHGPCKSDQFRCKMEGRCVPLEWKCDNVSDCDDNSDENSCESSTVILPTIAVATLRTPKADVTVCNNETHFNCQGFEGNCIPKKFVCDGEEDCRYGEDEQNCAGGNTDVSSGTTTSNSVNNNYVNVNLGPERPSTMAPINSSDASSTRAPAPTKCTLGYFKCKSNGHCIPQAFVCDMDIDCADGSDEDIEICSKPLTCSPNQWKCSSGECINPRFKCDRDADCLDGSDEKNCYMSEYTAMMNL